MVWLVFNTPRLLYRRERDLVRIVGSRGWLDGCGKSRPPVGEQLLLCQKATYHGGKQEGWR